MPQCEAWFEGVFYFVKHSEDKHNKEETKGKLIRHVGFFHVSH